MSSETGLELQFFDVDIPVPNRHAVQTLLLGGVGPLNPASLPKMSASFSAWFEAHELRALALLTDPGFSAGDAGGATAFDWVASIGADIASLAGMVGRTPPRANMESNSMATLGAGETEAEAFRPVLRNIDGVRVGFLAFSERPANGFDGRADLLHPMAYDRVRMLQAQCDHVIVFCHAGLPKANLPLPEWRARYRRFVDAGASVVVGMPPSGVSGWEEYRNGLVFYGLGTLADDRESADDCSLAVSLSLERNGRFQYETRLIERSGGALRFSENEAEKQLINERNALFFDEQAYLTRSTEFCREIYDAWKRETGVFRTPGLGRGIFGALLSQSVQNAKREDEAKLKALLENESLRLAVRRALAAREAEKGGRNA